MNTLASHTPIQLAKGKKCFIGPISVGLGDLIVSLPVVQAIIDQGFETTVVIRSLVQEGILHRLEGLSGTIKEVDYLKLPEDPNSFYINLRDHPLQTDYLWGSPAWYQAHGLMKIDQIVSAISATWQIEPDFQTLKPLKFVHRQEAQGKVIFVPGSIHGFKCWPRASWLALRDYFKNIGTEVLMVGQPDITDNAKDLLADLDWIETPIAADALDLISSARAVVSVDTGLMHMAVHQGIPTIALYQHRPVYERKYTYTRTVAADACNKPCLENYLDPPENRNPTLKTEILTRRFCQGSEDKTTSVCMTSITLEAVIEAVESLNVFNASKTNREHNA